jgi:DNA-binding MarR family transcriptional regulator
MPSEDGSTLSEAIWSVARLLRQASRAALAPWDISPSHARAMGAIGRHGPLRLSDLSEHLRIAPRSVTEVVDVLEERGWVRRTPDRSDRRAILVKLTAPGVSADQAIRAARDGSADTVFATLSDDDQAELARILATLVGPRDGD